MFEEVDAGGPPRGGGASTRELWKVQRTCCRQSGSASGRATTAAVGLAAQQIDKHVHGGAEGSNVAECHAALAQCLPAFLLRAARAATAARHRKAQFGAWIDHGVGSMPRSATSAQNSASA